MPKTIRLLSTYNGNRPNTILTLPDAIADSLLLGGVNATLDLTGGANPPVVPPANANEIFTPKVQTDSTGAPIALTRPGGGQVDKIGPRADLMRRMRLADSKGFFPTPLAPVTFAEVTGNWTPAATAASTTQEQIFTVPTMQRGDVVVSVTPETALNASLQIRAFRWVSATQVGVTFRNNSAGGPLTPSAGNYTVRVARFFGGIPPGAPMVTMSAAAAASGVDGDTNKLQTYLANSGKVRMRHPYAMNGTIGGGGIYAQSAAVSIVGSKVGYLVAVDFMTDAPKLEIVTTSYGQSIRVMVDDEIATPAPFVMAFKTTDIGHRLMLDFTQGGTLTNGTRKTRKIRVEMGANCHFGGVTVTKADSVWMPSEANAVRGLVLGDSFVQGSPTQDRLLNLGGATYDGFANLVGDLLGWDETIVSGLGSTGYLANTGTTAGNSPKWRDRIADFTGPAPDAILAFGSINDQTFTTAAVQAEVTAFWTAMVAALPNTVMFVAGLQSPKDTQNVANWNTAVKNGVEAVGSPNLFFIDMQSPTPWVYGTGDVVTPTNNGNADAITGNQINGTIDRIHPSMEGHVYYAGKLAEAIRAIIKTYLV
jgi:lysophospholipase L1-like esterase